MLKEVYRLVTAREGDKVFKMPALQAVQRQQIALALKGKGPAGRAVLQTVNEIERELAALTAAETKKMAEERPMSAIETARRIAFVLEQGVREAKREAVACRIICLRYPPREQKPPLPLTAAAHCCIEWKPQFVPPSVYIAQYLAAVAGAAKAAANMAVERAITTLFNIVVSPVSW